VASPAALDRLLSCARHGWAPRYSRRHGPTHPGALRGTGRHAVMTCPRHSIRHLGDTGSAAVKLVIGASRPARNAGSARALADILARSHGCSVSTASHRRSTLSRWVRCHDHNESQPARRSTVAPSHVRGGPVAARSAPPSAPLAQFVWKRTGSCRPVANPGPSPQPSKVPTSGSGLRRRPPSPPSRTPARIKSWPSHRDAVCPPAAAAGDLAWRRRSASRPTSSLRSRASSAAIHGCVT